MPADFLQSDFLKQQMAREAAEDPAPTHQGGLALGGQSHYMQPTGDSNPDAFSSNFSRDSQRGNYTGFGPGDYSGDYTGSGDRVYWGPYNDPSVASSESGTTFHTGFTPATAVIGAITHNVDPSVTSSTGNTVLLPPSSASQTTSVAADVPVPPPPSLASEAVPGTIQGSTSVGSGSSRGSFGDSFTTLRSVGPRASTATSGDTIVLGQDSATSSGTGTTDSSTGETVPTTVAADAPAPAWRSKAPGWGKDVPLGDEEFYTHPAHAKAGRLPELPAEVAGSKADQAAMQAHLDKLSGDEDMRAMQAELDRLNADAAKGEFASDSYTGTDAATGSDGVKINSNIDRRVIEPRAVDPTITRDSGYLLSDLEQIQPYDLDLSAASSAGTEVPSGLSEYMSDIGNLSLSSEGIGISGGALAGFAKARLTDVGIGMLISPFFKMIDEQSGNSWPSRFIQLSLATLGYVVGGDPFGLIAAPIGWAIQEFIQKRARQLDNDDPEAIKGKKFGYVREGNKWYPAVSESQAKDLGDPKSTFTMQYGDKLKWEQEKGTGTWYPTFDHARFKTFSVDDKEIYGAEGGNEFRERADPLRDFWIMDNDDTTAMLKNFAGGDLMRQYRGDDDHVFTAEEQQQIQDARSQAFDSFTAHDGRSWKESWAPQNEGGNARFIDGSWTTETDWYGKDYAPTVDSQQDSRAALDFIHDYRHSPSGSTDKGSGDFWTGSIKLRRLINEQGAIGSAQWAAAPRLLRGKNAGRPAYWDMPEGADVGDYVRNTGLSRNEQVSTNTESYFEGQAENTYYLDQFNEELAKLYTSQQAAAFAMGFKDKYKTGPEYDSYQEQTEHPDDFWWKNMINKTGWSRLYHDNSWDMPDVTTAEQLHDELLDIEEAGGAEYIGSQHYRNTAQQHYLAQKAIVRYWAQKVDGLGGGPQLQKAWNQNPSYYANAPPPFWQEGDSEDGYSPGWHYGGGPGDDVKNPIEGVAEYAQSSEDEMLENVQQAMDGYRTMGIIQGVQDPDYVAGRWDDYESYWESTGRPTPEVDGVPQVWSKEYEKWVAPSPIEDTGWYEADTWQDGAGAEDEGGIPEGWTRQGDYVVAPDGTIWDPKDDLHMFPYDDDLKAAAKTAKTEEVEPEKVVEPEVEPEYDTVWGEPEPEPEPEDPWARRDREALEAEEALAAAGVTHTQGAEPEDPGHSNVGVWTTHHEGALDYHPDETIPQHIPSFVGAASAASFPPHQLHTNVAPSHIPHIKTI